MSTEEKAAAASSVSVCVIDHDIQLLHALGSAIAAQPDFGEPLLCQRRAEIPLTLPV
jgi:hypothetical protein